ncbi:hypothetical protein D9V41_06110 [Aeromicrobium phragmitis]|uniref:Uncharacterized protein n=2 Tax=Aeromicrobium phragmitis TaxID=2478914 RepID=A0A3L8PMK1_9ACTN|nr:hypothetical protein D9V41_06110 [Aeromicrobium phragmitis]
MDAVAMILVQTEADLTRFWRLVRAGLDVPSPQVSFVLIDAHGAPSPQVTTIDGLPPRPVTQVVEQLSEVIEESYRRLTPGGTVGLLWSRPGRGPIRAGESAWMRRVGESLRRRRVIAWPAHVANDAYLRVVGADDLAA